MERKKGKICTFYIGAQMEKAPETFNVLFYSYCNTMVWWKRTTIYIFSVLAHAEVFI
jgi:hypothetical protein